MKKTMMYIRPEVSVDACELQASMLIIQSNQEVGEDDVLVKPELDDEDDDLWYKRVW